MNRMNIVLLVLLLVQGAWLGVRQFTAEPGQDSAAARGLLLPGLDPDGVTEILIEDGEATEDGTVTLVRKDGWTVAERWGYSADDKKVEELLRELAALQIADVVSTTGLHEAELGVGDSDFTKKVTLRAAGGELVLYLGTSGRGGSTHARVQGSQDVVAVSDFSAWKVASRPDGWVQRQVVDVDPATVTSVVLVRPDGGFELLKRDEAWMRSDGDEESPAEGAAAEELVRKASKVSASKVLGEYGAIEGGEVLKVILTTESDVLRYTVWPGESEGKYALAREDGAHKLEVGSWVVEPLLSARFEDYAAPPPAP